MRKRRTRRGRRTGFTLMEVLLVLAILVILGTMTGVFFFGIQQSAFEDTARTQIAQIEQALDVYRLNVGSYPSPTHGLESLLVQPPDLNNPQKWRGPYLDDVRIPPDPWGNSYQYDLPTPQRCRLWSWGADGIDGNEDDVVNIQE